MLGLQGFSLHATTGYPPYLAQQSPLVVFVTVDPRCGEQREQSHLDTLWQVAQ